MWGGGFPGEESRWGRILGVLSLVVILSQIVLPASVLWEEGGREYPPVVMYSRTDSRDDSRAVPQTEEDRTGQTVTGFALTSSDGKSYELTRLAKEKKAVVVNFFGIYCGPCTTELPEFEAMYQEFKDRGVAVLIIGRESPADLKRFAEKTGYKMPFLSDPDGTAFNAFGVQGIPRTFLLDSKLNILMDITGYSQARLTEMKNRIRQLISASSPEKKSPPPERKEKQKGEAAGEATGQVSA